MRIRTALVLGLFLILCTALSPEAAAQAKRVNVRFPAGASGATYNNSVSDYGTADFIIRASAGQRMNVRLNSRNRFLYFSVARGSGDGESIAAATSQATAWSGTLPATDTYVVRV